MFEKLLGLVGDNAEAKAEIGAIAALIKNNDEQKQSTIDSLQSQFDSVKEEKDRYKLGNQLVKKALGIEKIDDETVKEKLKELSGNDKTSKDIQELTQALAGKDDEIKNIKTEYEERFNTMRVDAELAKAIDANSDVLVDDPLIRSAFRDLVSKNVGVVGEGISPFTVVGDQRVPVVHDGKAQSVTDYVKTVLSGEQYASFRKTSTKNSPGPSGGGGNPETDVKKMTPSEKFAHYQQKAQGAN
ncbi:hypothetical protein PF327_10820 [Sulfurovum sp. XTW-4]|uniref:Phage minor structural protein GP20 n=1 Tax=Sulfurovum xiamenensis TaxID=3019066 RepID=A0ABT7QUC7_9BACT|nr:hypothetical protein [Sulfurovum xiamenensis]MDM5264687.1 hypothetical protein [Sulfurovum xiamenensis]